MTFVERMTEDRRGIILRSLLETTDYRLNEDSLISVLRHVGQTTPRDTVRQDLQWLQEHALVSLEQLPLPGGASLWIGILTRLGAEVAGGRIHVGVARQAPRG